MAALLVSHRRPGFYFRVITEGQIEAGQDIVKIGSGPEQVSVAEIDALPRPCGPRFGTALAWVVLQTPRRTAHRLGEHRPEPPRPPAGVFPPPSDGNSRRKPTVRSRSSRRAVYGARSNRSPRLHPECRPGTRSKRIRRGEYVCVNGYLEAAPTP